MTPDQVKIVVGRQSPDHRKWMIQSLGVSSLKVERWLETGEGMTDEEVYMMRDWALGRYGMTVDGMQLVHREPPVTTPMVRPPLHTKTGGPVVDYGDPANGVMAVPGAMRVIPGKNRGRDLPDSGKLKDAQLRAKQEAEREALRQKQGPVGKLMNFGR